MAPPALFHLYINGNYVSDTSLDCTDSVLRCGGARIPLGAVLEAILVEAPSPTSLEIYCHTLQWYCVEAVDAAGDDALREVFSRCFTGKDKQPQTPLVEQSIAFEPLADARTQALQADLLRMLDGRWRISTLNATFSVCQTYPRLIAVPSKVSDTLCMHAARFRTRSRLPILSYRHAAPPHACICRSSQPQTGWQLNRSVQDEKLVDAIRLSGGGESESLLIVDARPTANALVHSVSGGGVESMGRYKGCQRIFLSIENIHVLRECADRFLQEVISGRPRSPPDWCRAARRSGWQEQVASILAGAHKIKAAVLGGTSVLVHCSDGWDRTAQLSSLAAICLDPFYRTHQGLLALLDREWLQAGHRFECRYPLKACASYRISLESPAREPDDLQRTASRQPQANHFLAPLLSKSEAAPILPIFLDCLSQLVAQSRSAFAYGQGELLSLWDQLYARAFFGNCELERAKLAAPFQGFALPSSERATVWGDGVVDFDPAAYIAPLASYRHSAGNKEV